MSHYQRQKWLQAIRQSGAILILAAIVALTANHFRPDRLALVANWSPEARLSATPSGESLAISLEEAEVLFFSEQAVFIDARPYEYYQSGHVEGARSLPWEDFEALFLQVMADVAPDTPIITYCDGEGCGLSKELSFALLEKGFTNVRVLVDGWSVWQHANLPIER